MNSFKLIFPLLLLVLCSCTQGTIEDSEQEVVSQSINNAEITEQSETIEYPFNEETDLLANYLAGFSSKSKTVYSTLENEDWNQFKQSIDDIWTATDKKVPGMRTWSSEQLNDLPKNGTLFYPFSGPDFLHADIFFPEIDSIIMVGLEPIGSYPDLPELMKDTSGVNYLNGVHKSLHALLRLSFFRTIAMADDFKGEVDGTLPVFLHFMSRNGYTVHYHEKVALRSDGTLTDDLSKASDSSYFANRFYYKKGNEDKMRVLTYFAVNLQNVPYVSRGGLVAKGLETRTDFTQFLEKSNISATYLKSASYLMHRPTFSIVRDIILNESEYLLQDDSGIPVAFFDRDQWDLTFYGNFEEPISLFEERQQEDLKAIYDSTEIEIQPLPFGIGYQFAKGTSNLMKASKK